MSATTSECKLKVQGRVGNAVTVMRLVFSLLAVTALPQEGAVVGGGAWCAEPQVRLALRRSRLVAYAKRPYTPMLFRQLK